MDSTISVEEAAATIWDAVVIGGGPAGGFTALLLAGRGLKVLLLDRERPPRPKVCGACINPLGISYLAREGILSGIDSKVALRKACIFSKGKSISFNLRGGAAIDRGVLDAHLIQEGIRRGASALFGSTAKIVGVASGNARVSLTQQGTVLGELAAKIVVAAYGLSGLRTMKPDEASEFDSYIGAGAVGPNSNNLSASCIFMALGKHGYVGGTVLADGSLDSAAALSPAFIRASGGIGESIAAILSEAGLSGALRSDMNWRGTPLLSREGTVAGERFFAVGDACGYVEPFTGEGITWALESAYFAAPIIARAANRWDSGFAREWQQLYRSTLLRRKRLCRSVQMLLRTPPFFRDNALRAARIPLVARTAGRLIGGEALSWI